MATPRIPSFILIHKSNIHFIRVCVAEVSAATTGVSGASVHGGWDTKCTFGASNHLGLNGRLSMDSWS